MDRAQPVAVLSAHDRLGVSAFGSLLVHMLIVLGITFAAPKLRELQGLPTLEITLVQTRSDKAPDKPEFLAQAHQDGGGTSERADIARNPLPVREISDRHRDLPAIKSMPQPKIASRREVTDVLSQRADKKVRRVEPKPDKKELRDQPSNLGFLEQPDSREERAHLNAEISRVWQEYQKRPKRKFLNARTQEYKYAAYMDAWRAKVERIGNLNYPEEARRRGLTGNLVLDVALFADGSIDSVSIRRSSGFKLLDDAAVRIVELAAPFSPFPGDIRADTDIMHITRTWKFNDALLSTEN